MAAVVPPPPAAYVASAIAGEAMGRAELSTTERLTKALASAESGASASGASGAAGPDVFPAADEGEPALSATDESALGAPKPGATLPLGDRLEVSAGTAGLFSFSDVSTQVSLFAEGRYRLNAPFQIGMSLTYRYQSLNGVTSSAFQGLAGPVFNFSFSHGWLGEGEGLENAVFVSPKVGLSTGQTKFNEVVVGSNTEPTFSLTVGKRFSIAKWVAYAPSAGIVKELHFGPNFTLQPIALSVFF